MEGQNIISMKHQQQTDRLRQEVTAALRNSGYPMLRYIHIATEGSAVILQGKVPNFHMKQLAQAVVIQTKGVGLIRNDLIVG